MTKPPKEITICYLEVVVMPNGEVISAGKSLGWVSALGKYLTVAKKDEAEVLPYYRSQGGTR